MAVSLLYPIPRAAVRAFLASGKRHFLLTGGRGAGKSTLLAAVLPLLGASNAPDILTFARPKQGVYLCRTATGECTRIGVFDPSLPGPDTRMRPVPEGFCTLGIAALDAAPPPPRTAPPARRRESHSQGQRAGPGPARTHPAG